MPEVAAAEKEASTPSSSTSPPAGASATSGADETTSLPFEHNIRNYEGTSGGGGGGSGGFCIKWIPTSNVKLNKAEEVLLKASDASLKRGHVKLKSGDLIWTVVATGAAAGAAGATGAAAGADDKTPLVMVHGLGGGTGLWVLNLASLSKSRTLYTFDLLGFGQSSRPKFSGKSEKSESKFVESIEEWREKVGISRMILLGHSFGGYLSASYALKYPHRVRSLILVDPWGFEGFTEKIQERPWWVRYVLSCLSCCSCNPLFALRGAGPYGPRLIRKARGDFRERYEVVTSQDKHAVHNYIYHCNAAEPSGEEGFKSLTEFTLFPLNPMIERIGNLDPGIPLSFIFGAQSWVGNSAGFETQNILGSSQVQVHVSSHLTGYQSYHIGCQSYHNE